MQTLNNEAQKREEEEDERHLVELFFF